MSGAAADRPNSLGAAFATRDPTWVGRVRRVSDPGVLAEIARVWIDGARPWAARQAREYFLRPPNRPGHERLFRHLLWWAEGAGEDRVMGAAMVACDRLICRRRVGWYEWLPGPRRMVRRERLASPRDRLASPGRLMASDPRRGHGTVAARDAADGRLFTYRTRRYFQRRVWRYFRRLAAAHPERYLAGVESALVAYRDADLDRGERLLDSWGLLHVAFRHSDVLRFGAHHVWPAEGRRLEELRAAPAYAELWRSERGQATAGGLVEQGGSWLVRRWAAEIVGAADPDADAGRRTTAVRAVEPASDRHREILAARREDREAFFAVAQQLAAGREDAAGFRALVAEAKAAGTGRAQEAVAALAWLADQRPDFAPVLAEAGIGSPR